LHYSATANSVQFLYFQDHVPAGWRLETSLSSSQVKAKVTLRLTVSQSVLVPSPIWASWPDSHYCLTVTVLFYVGHPLWREDGSVFCICYWPLPALSFSGPSPLVLATILYCLRIESFLFVASYDSQGHCGGIRPRLRTGFNSSQIHSSL
jgi:hypothetical protein